MTNSFKIFGLAPFLLNNIAALGYKEPTPVQREAIAPILKGRDVLAAAQTGTGKTAAFALPLLTKLTEEKARRKAKSTRTLILAPTRELAAQIEENFREYAAGTQIKTALVFGGVNIRPQKETLATGVDVLVATPGRLLDHISQGNLTLGNVRYLVLDEADRMLDMGFLPDISRILKLLPGKRQSLMFSATFSPEIKKLAKNFLTNPVYVEVARENSVAETVEQILLRVKEFAKTDALVEILRRGYEDREPAESALVFVNSKLVCRRLARKLEHLGFAAEAIHGDRTQEERMLSLERFKNGLCKVLVATDVAARGLDIAQLPCVINYDVPFVAEDYVHRIGRTGRAGAKGLALMLATAEDERNVEAIERLTKQKFTPVQFEVTERNRRAPKYPRRDRDDDHEGRIAPVAMPIPKASYDPIFDAPYEPSGKTAKEEPRKIEEFPERTKKKAPKLSALLGGFPK